MYSVVSIYSMCTKHKNHCTHFYFDLGLKKTKQTVKYLYGCCWCGKLIGYGKEKYTIKQHGGFKSV